MKTSIVPGVAQVLARTKRHLSRCKTISASAAATLGRGAVLAAALGLGGAAHAQVPIPPSTQFDISGFIQEATLDPSCATDPHCGGTIKVNGHVITIPKETVVMLPANALTWQELFTESPAPYTGVATGMALADVPAPLTTYEVSVSGNRVLADANHPVDSYIAGLVNISQHALNSGAGFINCMDYSVGEMRIGGTLGDCTTGTRVRLNDPVGRFGRVMTPDGRFTVDPDNPTMIAGTGFPMCFPRVDPATGSDPLCPEGNRPRDVAGNAVPSFTMPDPATLAVGQLPNPRIQAPFEVGDYVTFAGTLVTDTTATPTVGPFPGTANTFVSAHTITNNVAIYTAPGTSPAYVMVEVTLIGTGGLNVLGAGEAAVRTRFEGMTTDPSRNIHLYGIDLNPADGSTSDRDWGTIGVDPGPPNGAVKGRWRFRPPCKATPATVTDKDCSPPPSGIFVPPTREMRAVIEGLQSQNPASASAVAAANGIFFGQYHAPISEYIFPENVPGTPIVENNFNAIEFLARGGYTSALGTLVGVLNPWPSNVLPSAACAAPVVNPGGPYTVASGGTVTLAATSTGTAPVSFAWSTPNLGTLSSTAVASPAYTAPVVGAQTTDTLSVTATNACGSSTASTIVTINAAAAPTVAHVAPISVNGGTSSSFIVSGTDPANLALTFAVTQTGAPALTGLTVTQLTTTSARVNFTAPVLPVGQTTPSVINLAITATNAAGVLSAAEFTTVTINPAADVVAITAGGTEYRTGKQRLIVNASSSVISPNVVLTLQPYLTQQGTIFDPAILGGATFTNNGGGLYLITLVGAPAPMCNPGGPLATPCSARPLTVKSNLGGVSAPAGLDRVRN